MSTKVRRMGEDEPQDGVSKLRIAVHHRSFPEVYDTDFYDDFYPLVPRRAPAGEPIVPLGRRHRRGGGGRPSFGVSAVLPDKRTENNRPHTRGVHGPSGLRISGALSNARLLPRRREHYRHRHGAGGDRSGSPHGAPRWPARWATRRSSSTSPACRCPRPPPGCDACSACPRFPPPALPPAAAIHEARPAPTRISPSRNLRNAPRLPLPKPAKAALNYALASVDGALARRCARGVEVEELEGVRRLFRRALREGRHHSPLHGGAGFGVFGLALRPRLPVGGR